MVVITIKNTMPGMGMASSGQLARQVGVRGILLVLGFGSLLWSTSVVPSVWLATQARDVIVQILEDHRFKPEELRQVLASVARETRPILSHPDLGRAQALIHLGLAEEMMQRKQAEEADRALTASEEKIKLSLCLNPFDPFLWLKLYSVANLQNGFEEKSLSYLGQSYGLGPMEGWIALRRNKFSLAVLPILSGTLQEKVTSEFAAMVSSDFTEDAAVNLSSVGWIHRDRLLASLTQADMISREAFARKLAYDGVRVSVPGVEIGRPSER